MWYMCVCVRLDGSTQPLTVEAVRSDRTSNCGAGWLSRLCKTFRAGAVSERQPACAFAPTRSPIQEGGMRSDWRRGPFVTLFIYSSRAVFAPLFVLILLFPCLLARFLFGISPLPLQSPLVHEGKWIGRMYETLLLALWKT